MNQEHVLRAAIAVQVAALALVVAWGWATVGDPSDDVALTVAGSVLICGALVAFVGWSAARRPVPDESVLVPVLWTAPGSEFVDAGLRRVVLWRDLPPERVIERVIEVPARSALPEAS